MEWPSTKNKNMDIKQKYVEETGGYPQADLSEQLTHYVKWLEAKILEPQILTWIKTMFKHAEEKEWFETYFVFDVHGTITRPDYRKETKEVIYYPYAKETLQLLSERLDTIIIMFTSSYPEEIEFYNNEFKKDNINFKYINENPEISDAKGAFGYYYKKMYFNVFFDDKTGFNAETDWEPIYNFLKETTYLPNPNWSKKTKEKYHKK